jgi:pimeloyl-ACP methyl ester carboxylesterase
METGVDSLGAVELRNTLQQAAGAGNSLPSTLVFDHPTARQLSSFLGGTSTELPPLASESQPQRHRIAPLNESRLGPVLVVLNAESDSTASPLVVTSSIWGTVDHFSRLAQELPFRVWGLTHGYLHTGDASYLATTTLEQHADGYATLVLQGCALCEMSPSFHILGGSFGAMLSAKVACAARQQGARPGVVVLIDPPYPGPSLSRGMHEDRVALAMGDVRLARQVAGVEVGSLADLRGLFDQCDSDDWSDLAMVATRERERVGQSTFDEASVRRSRRRMQVHIHHLQLWTSQDELPEPYNVRNEEGLPGPSGIVQILTTGCSAFFDPISRDEFSRDRALYGDPLAMLPVIEGEHTAVIQQIATGRVPDVTAAIQRACEGRM